MQRVYKARRIYTRIQITEVIKIETECARDRESIMLS